MSEHLSSEQLSWWIAGERSAAAESHVHACAACRDELVRCREALALFRESGEQWSNQLYTPSCVLYAPSCADRRRPSHLRIAAMLTACALASILLVFAPAPRGPEPAPFVRIPYVAPPAPYERIEIRRMEVPVTTLLTAGLTLHGPAEEGAVRADVVLGQDGRALAIRLAP
jgi:hypothetical protein